jgi:20S proteasome subunit alpha 2
MGDSAYSFSLTTFSRTGKLLQIEYALNAVANGRTSLGICAKDGVVIATDKKMTSTLVDIQDVTKIEEITKSSGFVYSGVGPDYRVLGKNHGEFFQKHLRRLLIRIITNGKTFFLKLYFCRTTVTDTVP